MKMWVIKKGKMYLGSIHRANNTFTKNIYDARFYSTEKRAQIDIVDGRETVVEVEVNIKEAK